MEFKDQAQTIVFKKLIIGASLDAKTGCKIELFLENGITILLTYHNYKYHQQDCQILKELLKEKE